MKRIIKEKLSKKGLTEEEFAEFLRISGVRRREHNQAMQAYRKARSKDPSLPDKRMKIKEI